MSDSRICRPVIGIGPNIGSGTQTDSRICKAVIGVGPDIGERTGSLLKEDGFNLLLETGGKIKLE